MDTPWIALVGPEVEENLSLRYLAASLAAAGFRCELLAFNSERDFPRVLQSILAARTPPLCVGLSLAFQWRAEDFLALALALREGGYAGHITAGGHFATFATDDLLNTFPTLDSVCLFESEETLPALARALAQHTRLEAVAGLALRSPLGVNYTERRAFPDLAKLPHPDRRGEPARCFGHAIMPLIGSRGCYGHCGFCSIAAWHDGGGEGRRFRVRAVDDVADEMAAQHRARGVEIFVFQDDNFFFPRTADSLARINALADALALRGVERFATVVKARSNDVQPEVFRALVERLHCLRAYVGIETDADQGLRTLGRNASRAHNRRALEVIRALDLYICFNLLVFDPDTTLDTIEANTTFMRAVADFPFCVGRVELYAGTPLLSRMQREGRCRGDFMRWDYALRDARVERAFRLFMDCLAPRNYGDAAAVVQLWLLRFDIEACRHFHPREYRPAWREQGADITRRLSLDTVAALEAIVAHVRSDAPPASDVEFASRLAPRAAAVDREVLAASQDLAERMSRAVGHDASLSEIRRASNLYQPSALGA